jgi:PGF-pre-PGF domain-containing protein
MKGLNSLALLLVILTCLFSFVISTDDVEYEQIIIKYDDNVISEEKMKMSHDYNKTQLRNNTYVLSVPSENTDVVIDTLEKSNDVEYVMKDPIVKIDSSNIDSYSPNDPSYYKQWNMRNTNVDDAWDVTKGNKSTIVAVIDTGVDYNHPDLVDACITNGYDYVENDEDPMDENGHGTHCAGIVAATQDNNKGVSGVAQVSILPIRVLDSDGSGYTSDVANGIYYATDHGADIISMSLGSESSISYLENACNYARSKGVILVAASGNDYSTSFINWPAAYDSVIAVGATESDNDICPFSNRNDKLSVVAPGNSIYSTYYSDNYDYLNGTSMATPLVAGTFALFEDMYPEMSVNDAQYFMEYTAIDLGSSGFDSTFGHGLINAYDFVTIGNGNVNQSKGAIPFPVKFTGTSSNSGSVSWYWDFGDGNTSTEQNPEYVYTEPGVYSPDLTIVYPGETNLTLDIEDIEIYDVSMFDMNKTSVCADETIKVDVCTSITENISFIWDFGDNTSHVTGRNATHVYTDIGEFNITLNATYLGNDYYTTRNITVIKPPYNSTYNHGSDNLEFYINNSSSMISTNVSEFSNVTWFMGNNVYLKNESNVTFSTFNFTSDNFNLMINNGSLSNIVNDSNGNIKYASCKFGVKSYYERFNQSTIKTWDLTLINKSSPDNTRILLPSDIVKGNKSVEFGYNKSIHYNNSILDKVRLNNITDPTNCSSFIYAEEQTKTIDEANVSNNIYQCMNISLNNESNDTFVYDNITIEFKISKNEIDEKSIDVNTIDIIHHNGTTWENMGIVYENETTLYRLYHINTSILSPFAMVYDVLPDDDGDDDNNNGGGSSGGSGGGGGLTPEDMDNIKSTEVCQRYISNDHNETYEFKNFAEHGIQSIDVVPQSTAGRITTTIEHLKSTSSMLTESAPGMVYSNINIWMGYGGYATEDNIDDVVITYTVNESWVYENNINQASVSLYEYDNGWKSLDCERIGIENGNILYSARGVTTFGNFAISGDVIEEDPVVTVSNNTSNSTVDNSQSVQNMNDPYYGLVLKWFDGLVRSFFEWLL